MWLLWSNVLIIFLEKFVAVTKESLQTMKNERIILAFDFYPVLLINLLYFFRKPGNFIRTAQNIILSKSFLQFVSQNYAIIFPQKSFYMYFFYPWDGLCVISQSLGKLLLRLIWHYLDLTATLLSLYMLCFIKFQFSTRMPIWP